MGHRFGYGHGFAGDARSGRVIEISGIGSFERFPSGERHDAIRQRKEVGITRTIAGRETSDHHDTLHTFGPPVSNEPGQSRRGRMSDHDDAISGVIDCCERRCELIVESRGREAVINTG